MSNNGPQFNAKQISEFAKNYHFNKLPAAHTSDTDLGFSERFLHLQQLIQEDAEKEI